jgi:dihydroneopterin aldolase
MEGIIKIESFKIHCIIGAHAYEREQDQEVSLDIEMRVDFSGCVQTDSIVDTVDYGKVAKVCRDLAQRRRYHLLETFAYEAINALKETFSPSWVRIRVRKKQAVPLAKAVCIELESSK